MPITIPGGKPVIEVPGLTPKSPMTTDGPVLVTAAAPRTAKLVAVPSGGAVAAETVSNNAAETIRAIADNLAINPQIIVARSLAG